MRGLAPAAVFTLCVTATMAPWIARNAVVLHAFVPTTTDAGHGFYVANNALAVDDPRGFSIPPDWSFVKRAPEEQPGEAEVSRRLMGITARYLVENPPTAARLMGGRFLAFWRFWPKAEFVSQAQWWVYALSYAPIFPFIVAGLWLAHRRLRDSLRDLALVDALVIFMALIHAVFLVMLRYREPLMPFLLTFAGLALWRAWLGARAWISGKN